MRPAPYTDGEIESGTNGLGPLADVQSPRKHHENLDKAARVERRRRIRSHPLSSIRAGLCGSPRLQEIAKKSPRAVSDESLGGAIRSGAFAFWHQGHHAARRSPKRAVIRRDCASDFRISCRYASSASRLCTAGSWERPSSGALASGDLVSCIRIALNSARTRAKPSRKSFCMFNLDRAKKSEAYFSPLRSLHACYS
jgi:hypothetical protein